MDMNEEQSPLGSSSKDDEILEHARAFLLRASEAESDQRSRERDELRFLVPEFQWTDEERRERAGDAIAPARPILSISKLNQPLRLVSNQMRSADLGITIHPISEDANDETAEVIQGLYRDIERRSRAQLARGWAFDRARAVGRGSYRILTEYDDQSDDPSDQRIVIKRILHQESVYFDPEAEEPDFSDGRALLFGGYLSREAFRRAYPGVIVATTNSAEWKELQEEAPEWVRDNDVFVAEYWYRDIETENGRDIVRGVYYCKVSGWQVIERQEWPGKFIPFVPVIGDEMLPFDGQRRWSGMVGPAKDGQKLYNYAATSVVERMAIEPKTPFVMYDGQDEGHEQMWQQANVRNFPALKHKPMLVGGQLLPPPQRAQIDQSGLSISMAVLHEADNFIQATTAVYEPSLGRVSNKERSGRAIQALQQQADAGTSQYLQNLADISIPYEARIILDLIPAIYDRPGRIARIIRGDDTKSDVVMLNRPYVLDQRTKRPRAIDSAHPDAKHFDLRKGIYSVSASVGKDFQTRLDEGAGEIAEILDKWPQAWPMIADIYLHYRKFPGARDMAKRFAKIRERDFPGIGEGEQGQAPPEQAQARVQALEQQLQQMQQQLQMAGQAIATDQAKHQAMIEMKKVEMGARLEIERMTNATKIAVARIAAAKGTLDELREDQEEAMALGLEQQHEADQTAQDRAHEVAMAALQNRHARQGQEFDAAHEAGMAAAGGKTLNMTLDRGDETGTSEPGETAAATEE